MSELSQRGEREGPVSRRTAQLRDVEAGGEQQRIGDQAVLRVPFFSCESRKGQGAGALVEANDAPLRLADLRLVPGLGFVPGGLELERVALVGLLCLVGEEQAAVANLYVARPAFFIVPFEFACVLLAAVQHGEQLFEGRVVCRHDRAAAVDFVVERLFDLRHAHHPGVLGRTGHDLGRLQGDLPGIWQLALFKHLHIGFWEPERGVDLKGLVRLLVHQQRALLGLGSQQQQAVARGAGAKLSVGSVCEQRGQRRRIAAVLRLDKRIGARLVRQRQCREQRCGTREEHKRGNAAQQHQHCNGNAADKFQLVLHPSAPPARCVKYPAMPASLVLYALLHSSGRIFANFRRSFFPAVRPAT